MSWVTVIWSMNAAVCLTLAGIHLVVWLKARGAWGHLFFSFSATAAAAVAACELLLLRADSVERYDTVVRWAQVPLWVLIVSIVWFTRFHLCAGRPWLAWAVTVSRTLTLVLNFLVTPNINYKALTGLSHIQFLGESIAMPVGTVHPWDIVPKLSSLLLLVFLVNASIEVWRRGERRALFLGGSMIFFITAATVHSMLVARGMIQSPHFISFAFLGIIVAMAFELSREVLRASRLVHELQARETDLRTSQERMTLAAEAAQLGLWTWDISGNSVWLTDKLRALLGYSATENVTYENFLMRVHEEDRTAVAQAVQQALAQGGRFHSEYRVALPDGALRWFSGRGQVKTDVAGTPVQMLGVVIDITERHRVEEESRQVSGKLITAQEDERKRIARDLHDDLNQRLALLSIEMQLFGSASTDTSGPARERLESMTSQVKDLSSEVHRLSYQLHPAKLDQLGLVVAARTFCREVSLQAGVAVHFEQHDVPRDVGIDVALCLYRVIQEAVQNSVRHNGSAPVQVSLTLAAAQIRLLITDEGKGFDVDHAIHNGGLGLVSMRERVRQVHGSIQFTSSLGKGTRIEVHVPLLHQTPVV